MINTINRIDTFIYDNITLFKNDYITSLMIIITNFASALFIIGITILLCVQLKNRKYNIYIILNLIMIFIVNRILKYLFARPRPNVDRLVEESGYSFPSAHTMIGTAFYGFLIYLIIKEIKNKKIKYTLSIILGLLIFMIGISRVYLGVHYATDVIMGFVFAAIYLILYIKFICNKENFRKFR